MPLAKHEVASGRVPAHVFCRLYYSPGRRHARLAFTIDDRDHDTTLYGRHARLLKVLVDARNRDATNPGFLAGWRTRARLMVLLDVGGVSTVTQYGAGLIQAIEQALVSACGATPGWKAIDRQPDLGFRLSDHLEIEVLDLDSLQNDDGIESARGPLS